MPYCTNCGKKLNDGVRVCLYCGEEVDKDTINNNYQSNNTNSYSTNHTQTDSTNKYTSYNDDEVHSYNNFDDEDEKCYNTKKEYSEKNLKCPHCGEIITSLTCICPSCGYEIKNDSVVKSVKEFASKIEYLENKASLDTNTSKYPLEKFYKKHKVIWVLLNIFFRLLPAIFYYLQPYLFKKPKLSAYDEQKLNTIQNFLIPNDRETIIEALLYIKSKISYVNTSKGDLFQLYWLDVWKSKSEDLKTKTNLMLKNDEIVKKTYQDIDDEYSKTRNHNKKRAIIIVALCAIAHVFYI